jgi:phosphoglycolate phosphatase-like HAD superfamily hydrolase
VREPETAVGKAIAEFNRLVVNKLKVCPIGRGLNDFLTYIPKSAGKYVISGGMEAELHEVFKARNLLDSFHGVYGSPRNKHEIMYHLDQRGELSRPIVFVGDSQFDYETASRFDCDFIFMYGMTEFKDWEEFFSDKKVALIVRDFSELMEISQSISSSD